MKKGEKESGIHIHLSNRWLYTFIAIGILAAVGIGVYAYGTNSPSTFGHSRSEIELCPANRTMQMNAQGTAWICGTSAIDCKVIKAASYSTLSIVSCPSGYISTGGGAACQSALDRIGRSEGYDIISPTSSGWIAICYQGTTNIPSNTMASVICCR